MWVQGLEGVYFSGNPRGLNFRHPSDQFRLFGFDTETGAFTTVSTVDGDEFAPSFIRDNVVEVFDTRIVLGSIAGRDPYGFEPFELLEDGSLQLFADLVPRRASSDFRFVLVPDADAQFALGTIQRDIPLMLFANGQHALLADYYDGIDRFEDFSLKIQVGNEIYFVARANGSTSTAFKLNLDTGRLIPLSQADDGVRGSRVDQIYSFGDKIYALMHTGDLYGQELFELDTQGVWRLYDDLAPGAASSHLLHHFSYRGEHYFTGAQDGRHLNLYRLDKEGFSPVVPNPGTHLKSALIGSHFNYNGTIYLYADLGAERLFKLGRDGEITRVKTFGPDDRKALPNAFYDFDNETYDRSILEGGRTATYGLLNGELFRMTLPEGKIVPKGFHGGALYLEARVEGQDNLVYATSNGVDFVPVFQGYNGRSFGLTFAFSHLSETSPGRDVWFGNEAGEVIRAPNQGAVVYAEGGDDRVRGSGQADLIQAGDGNDLVRAGAGADRIEGQRGDDHLAAGDGRDEIRGDTGADRLQGDRGDDTLNGGIGQDWLFGGHGDDLLIGGAGDDRLAGGAGADQILGGQGNDLLIGNGGADVFLIEQGFGEDRIADFDLGRGGDRIDLTAFGGIEHLHDLRQNHLSQEGAGTVIAINRNRLTLEDVSITDLGSEDFIFA